MEWLTTLNAAVQRRSSKFSGRGSIIGFLIRTLSFMTDLHVICKLKGYKEKVVFSTYTNKKLLFECTRGMNMFLQI